MRSGPAITHLPELCGAHHFVWRAAGTAKERQKPSHRQRFLKLSAVTKWAQPNRFGVKRGPSDAQSPWQPCKFRRKIRVAAAPGHAIAARNNLTEKPAKAQRIVDAMGLSASSSLSRPDLPAVVYDRSLRAIPPAGRRRSSGWRRAKAASGHGRSAPGLQPGDPPTCREPGSIGIDATAPPSRAGFWAWSTDGGPG